ncbi:MAG: dicarboxylate/amino acid:cation symporter, partial [Gemmatimonadota bacterium]
LIALEPLGIAFIRLITMVVVPLVAASLLIGTASLGDLSKLGRIGGKTVAYYMTTTAIAVIIGIVLSNIVQPGARIEPETRDTLARQFAEEAGESMALAAEKPPLVETLLSMIPRNPVQAAAEMDLLPLIVFMILFGAAITLVEQEKKEAVLKFAEGVNDAVMVLIDWIMRLAPYAVFALIAAVVAQFGLDLLKSLLVYTLTVTAALLIHAFGTYAAVIRFLVKMSPITFLKRIIEVPVVAFSTSSSNATLPVTMETAEEDVGSSPEVSSFVLPLGATINMDGTAMYQAIATMFVAQIYGIGLGVGEQLTIVLTATLASIGAAGVPSAGIIILILVLNSVGLGGHAAAGIALILGVDRILDMLRTAVNVTGDLTAASFVAVTEGETLEPRPVDYPLEMRP